MLSCIRASNFKLFPRIQGPFTLIYTVTILTPMPIALVFFVHYAYIIIFLWVLAEQIGIPLPSIPLLLSPGTLSAPPRAHQHYIVLAVLSARLAADTIWFPLGRRYGN